MAAQSEPVLAITLSPKRMAAAELRFSDGELQFSALGDIQPPDGVFDGGQVASGETLGRVLSDFMNEKQVSAKNVVMVLPEATAITQLIKLPAMPREDMLGAVRAVAERYAVFAERAIAVDCSTIEEFEEDGNQMSNVLLAASREANVQQCQECARVAGLELLAVEAAPIAAARGYWERVSTSEVVALTVVGEVKTEVMIFDNGVLRLCCFSEIGGAARADTVSHVWYWGDREMARVPLHVQGARWRTWSTKRIIDEAKDELKGCTTDQHIRKPGDAAFHAGRLGLMLTRMRMAPYSQEEYNCSPENPPRLIAQLKGFIDCLAVVDGRREWSEEDYRIACRCVRDSLHPTYLKAIKALWRGDVKEAQQPMPAEDIKDRAEAGPSIFRQLDQWVRSDILTPFPPNKYGLKKLFAQDIQLTRVFDEAMMKR